MKAGVIGLGVGEAHVKTYLEYPQIESVVITDLNHDRAQEISQLSDKIQIVDSTDKLLSDHHLSIVSVCSYDSDHCEQVIEALKIGAHVFVEKPLCVTEEELDKIDQRFKATKQQLLSSNFILRCSPRFQTLKAKIQNGEFGSLYHLEASYMYGRLHKITEGWRADQENFTIIQSGGTHMIDLLHWLSNSRITRIAAIGNAICTQGTKYKGKDNVIAIVEFENGLTGKIGANFGCIFPHFHQLEVYGTKASFQNSLDEAVFYTGDSKENSKNRLEGFYPVQSKGLLLEDFISAVVDQRTPLISSQDVFDTMKVAFAIDQAVKERTFVEVQY